MWVALWGGAAVHRYTPDGRLDAVVAVPARKVTAFAFGGPGLDQLFITTSREGMAAGDGALAVHCSGRTSGPRPAGREFAG